MKGMIEMKIYAYCRVSTEQQNLDRQEDAIKKYVEENNGCLTCINESCKVAYNEKIGYENII